MLYPTVMSYLAIAPGLICGLALAVSDIRCRRVPLPWVAVGALVQLAVCAAYAVATHDVSLVFRALIIAALCTLLQLGLALIIPRSLGLGDVFAMIPIGLSVGMLSVEPALVWWLAMGVFGIIFIALWLRIKPQRRTPYADKVPFVPVIWSAALLTVLVSAC